MPYYRGGVCKCFKCGRTFLMVLPWRKTTLKLPVEPAEQVTTIKEAEAFGKANPANQ